MEKKGLDPTRVAALDRWVEKACQSKPQPVRVLMRRTIGTVVAILEEIDGMDFAKLSSSLYFYCRDVNMQQFTRLYESQLELAAVDPDKFAKGLHKFFNETANKIKKENLFQGFFEFNSLCSRIRYEHYTGDDNALCVINAYQNLLLQQMEYLRPDKFKFDQVVCGMTTTGEVMTAPEYFGDVDSIITEFKVAMKSEGRVSSQAEADALFAAICEKKGHPEIKSMQDMANAMENDKVYSHHTNALAPYINEYNFDILPTTDEIFSRFALPFYAIQYKDVSDAELVSMLKQRAKTLPTNGIVFKFEYPSPEHIFYFKEVLMKEVFRDDRVIMLYKLRTEVGAISGYYDTKDGFLYSVLLEVGEHEIMEKLRTLILYFYASATVRNGAELLASFKGKFFLAATQDSNLRLDFNIMSYGSGGKLRRVYGVDEEKKHGPTGPRAGNENYEAEPRNIAGFVRRVGEGKKPSQEAIARAQALGYDLGPDETFVQPFVKNVLKLVAKERRTEL